MSVLSSFSVIPVLPYSAVRAVSSAVMSHEVRRLFTSDSFVGFFGSQILKPSLRESVPHEVRARTVPRTCRMNAGF